MKNRNVIGAAIFDEDAFIRPGDLSGNAKVLLRAVRKAAKIGMRMLSFTNDSLCGGDCGSLSSHPAFKKAFEAEKADFLKQVAKIKGAPHVTFKGKVSSNFVSKGSDACFPFCGNPERVFQLQINGLSDRLEAMQCRNVVIGLSGGLDSALTLLVAFAAFSMKGYDIAGIHVYTMPGFGTTTHTRSNAELLCEGLGLKLEAIDITQACLRHFKDIGHPENLHDVVFENTQARERTQILMDKANQLGGIVLGTGDMSEIALGWNTFNGDHMSMFATNAGVPKTAVRDVCLWWASSVETNCNIAVSMDDGLEKEFSSLLKAVKAIRDIVATPVSPELLPAKGGEISQKTEDKIGPYELHDFFLWHFIAEQEGRDEILKAAKSAFKKRYDAATIKKWLDVFFKRFFSQSFKRNCAPDGVQIFDVYLAPNAWHMPSTISCSVFA